MSVVRIISTKCHILQSLMDSWGFEKVSYREIISGNLMSGNLLLITDFQK